MQIRRGKQPPFLCYCRCCCRWCFSVPVLPRFVFAVVAFLEPALQPFNIETMLLCIIWLKTSDRFTSSQVIWSFIVRLILFFLFPIFSLVYLVDLHFIFIHITHVLNEMFRYFFCYFVPPLLVPHRFLCFWFDYFLHLRITTRHRISCVHVCSKSE